MRIFIRQGVRTAREAPIQNRNVDPVGKWSSAQIPLQERGRSRDTLDYAIAGGAHTRSRSFTAIRSSVQLDARSPPQVVDVVDSLDYANHRRSPHAEPLSHSDRKSCSTRREISFPGRGYGCPNIADIVTPSAKELGITFRTDIGIAYVTTIGNQHSETVDRALVSRNSRVPRLRESLAETTGRAAQSQRSEVVFNSTRDLLPRSWMWVPEHRRYSHPLRFIPTPSVKELGITFRTGIGIAYVTTIRNQHSKTVDRALVSRNSILGPKFPPGVASQPAPCSYSPHVRVLLLLTCCRHLCASAVARAALHVRPVSTLAVGPGVLCVALAHLLQRLPAHPHHSRRQPASLLCHSPQWVLLSIAPSSLGCCIYTALAHEWIADL
ncbi:hypothetical protein Taro_032080 [Colocasia esculenta]|uniref:Uncharacterized protein n=1 Tax=Colocasia esculenta TaxID=4460 RepID=A0A843VYB1_COLES|nr:hypothetical protein [Colocasia esculenta]